MKRRAATHHSEQRDRNYEISPEKMLELIMSSREAPAEDWTKTRLPKLVKRTLSSYEKVGAINHLDGKDLPSKDSVLKALNELFTVLFPGYMGNVTITKSNIESITQKSLQSVRRLLVREIDRSLKYICIRELKCPTDVCHIRAQVIVNELLENIPRIRELLRGDIEAAYEGDPAARNWDEIILSYPFVLAITAYRIAHELHIRGVPIVPRIMTEHAHSATGIDIHPGAKIGTNFFIDHGTGVVIGETAEIGDNVRLYQGVTIGALSIPKGARIIRGTKRHPTIEDDVIIYSGATILGGDTVIGKSSIIGGNVWIISSVPPNTTVTISNPEQIYKNTGGSMSH
jgi:serine O-acetyltransferase